jgi:hypothetical protein
MSTLLVLSVGRTDVQLVTNHARQELDRDRCGGLHDQLEQRVHDWVLVDAPLDKAKPDAKELPNGIFQLCTPKADAVLNFLSDEVASLKVLILETCRKTRADDPRYAGGVVERRMKERGVLAVVRHAYLNETDEDFADSTNKKEAILRCAVVNSIEEAVRKNISSGIDRVLLATTGGPRPITSLIDEIVRLYSQNAKCEVVEIEDGATKNPPAPDRVVVLTVGRDPNERFRAKRHALELIHKGNLLAAWGAVSHLHADTDEHQWTQIVRWLADFASSMPLPDECDLYPLKHPIMAVRTALRVELALRAGDIPRAIHGTIAFFESALWDHLNSRLESKQVKGETLYRVNTNLPDTEVKQLNIVVDTLKGEHGAKTKPFEKSNETEGWFLVNDNAQCASLLVNEFLKEPELVNLEKAVKKVRYLRNNIAHNEPKPELMRSANNKMEKSNLWANDRFLTQSLVSNVLAELDVSNPASLCDNLINTVRDRLLNPVTNPS